MPERPTTGRRMTWALVSMMLVPTAGCATLIRPSTMQPVAITSDPPAARVFVDGEPIGVAPVVVDLNRRVAHYDLRAEKDGCPPRELRFGRSLSRWRFLPSWYFGATGAIVAAMRVPLLEVVAATSIWIGGASLFDRWTGARYTRPRTVQLSLRADMNGGSVSAADSSGACGAAASPGRRAFVPLTMPSVVRTDLRARFALRGPLVDHAGVRARVRSVRAGSGRAGPTTPLAQAVSHPRASR